MSTEKELDLIVAVIKEDTKAFEKKKALIQALKTNYKEAIRSSKFLQPVIE